MRTDDDNMMSPLRVAMVSARSLPLMGGIETHIGEVSTRLALRGVSVTILTTDLSGKLAAYQEQDGVVTRRFPAWPRSRDYYFSPKLVKALDPAQFDLVHVQGVNTALPPLALAAARRAGIPSVITFHTGGSSNAMRNAARAFQWRLERSELTRASKLIAVCEFEVEMFARSLRVPPDRIALVRNGAGGLPSSTQVTPFRGQPLILSIGRFERYKGHHRVVAAMKDVLRHAPQARLVLVGQGPYQGELEKLVAKFGVASVVSIASFGPTERGDLAALVRSANVVALMSEYEAHPVAVMEALSEGIDVVVAATSGLVELGRAGLVRTVELEANPSDLATELLEAASEHRWAAGPPTLPTWDDCVQSLLSIYAEVARCAS